MKKILVVLGCVLIGGASWVTLRDTHANAGPAYRLASVTLGSVESVVAATGTLDAVTTVQVGTQVSGIIDEICVDYNDPVRTGQVIARIDTTLLANAVAGAEAQLERTRAELDHARRTHERTAALRGENLVSESEANDAQYALAVARAGVRAAEVDLARARQNLAYATITSPIDGTVISRSVEVGQTVQSSFSAPDLFLIAGDLASMQMLVSVDESDIGRIAEGQEARFTVQAYPDDLFGGVVEQVRMQSATEDNVVNYTVVVAVANPDGRLLPGMSATVDFLVETADDVLYVSNASLRYRPDEETARAAMRKLREARGGQGRGAGGGEGRGSGAGAAAADRGLLWALDDDGTLAVVPVRTGISDGTSTVVTGPDLAEGMQVIAGVTSSAAAGASSNPFQQQKEARRPGPPSPGGF